MEQFLSKTQYDVYDLVELVALLRSADGCPWDREQTHKSITRNLLEEAYEAVEAIDKGDANHLKEELGDVLLQVVFHSQIEREQGGYDIDDIADLTVRKLINRHPHVFGELNLTSSADVIANWDVIKRQERGDPELSDVLSGVPSNLPALWRAEKLLGKLYKAELTVASELTDSADPEARIGADLFNIVIKALNAGIDPEFALHQVCDRIITNYSNYTNER